MAEDKRARILEGVMRVLARDGLAGVTMRAVATEAGVALGLLNYHFEDKDSLVAAALERIGEQDAELVAPEPGLDPGAQLRHALDRVAAPEFLEVGYLSMRLQLWSVAPTSPAMGDINRRAQRRYRAGLVELIQGANPDLDDAEAMRRAADILIIQNGVWLTSALIVDDDAIRRSIDRCLEIAMTATD